MKPTAVIFVISKNASILLQQSDESYFILRLLGLNTMHFNERKRFACLRFHLWECDDIKSQSALNNPLQ